MKKQHILLLIFSLYFLKPIADAKTNCSPASCGGLMQPEIRFPFRILDRQPAKCGFPGFDLSCDEQGHTILQLPSSLSYVVKSISYVDQIINIDPDFCGPNRISSLNMTNSPFQSRYLKMQDYTFYNCPQNYSFKQMDIPFPCLSNESYAVIAVMSFIPGYIHSNCTAMTTIEVPDNTDFTNKLNLAWYAPRCGLCEYEGKVCQLKSKDGDGQTICVSSSPGKGISRSVKLGLSIGIGVPALICIIGLVYYVSSRGQHQNNSNNQAYQGIDLSSLATIPQSASRLGLDGPTIESYPKTVVGDSCTLTDDDRTCAICLSDYKPKESLRTIPECNHYFHTKCIDEWLKLNATCPVCWKIPESSALVTPCSKASSSNSGG